MKNINKILVAMLVLATFVAVLAVIPASAEGAADGVALPEAEVTDIRKELTENDPHLTFALNFAIKDYENFTDEYIEALFNAYGKYYVDYVITFEGLSSESVTFNADGSADGYLSGRYGAWEDNAWVNVPFEDVTIENNSSLYIMEYAASQLGKPGLRMTLEEIAEIVVSFDCGIFLSDDFLSKNPDMKLTLELVIFTEDDANSRAIIEKTVLAKKVYYTPDAVDLPEAEVTDITTTLGETDPTLTYALNFQIKDYDNFTERYVNTLMAVYGKYYVDYILTIDGLTEDVVFNANSDTADGFLSGRYAAWENGAWIDVPFEDVTLTNGESLYIMEYAASQMGKPGLRMTLAEIAEIVRDFDCGIFFTDEFLQANPDMVVTLELVIFRENAEGEIINDTVLARNVFSNKVTPDGECEHIFEIKDDGHLYVSADNGENWKDLGLVIGADGRTPSLKLEDNGDVFIRYDDNDEWTLLGNVKGQDGENGENIQIPVIGGNDTLLVIIIAIVGVVAITIVAIVVINNRQYHYCKPWWLI